VASLEDMADRLAVSETLSRFFFAMDDKDWAGIGRLITDPFVLDAQTITGIEPTPTPRDDFLVELDRRNGGFAGTQHLNTNHVVEIDGDSARLRAFMCASHWVRPTREDTYVSYGGYRGEFQRADQGWLMSRLVLEVWLEEGDRDRLYAEAAERRAAAGAGS